MLIYNTNLMVEAYECRNDRIGAYDNEIVLNGWFLCDREPTGMSLVFPGDVAFEIEHRHLSSDDVHLHHGEAFGDVARRCRFRLIEPIGARVLDFQAAALRVDIAGSVAIETPIGAQYVEVVRNAFSAQDCALAARFESVGDNCELGLVQRQIGIERLGLLRFAGVGDPITLAEAIEARFCAYEGADEVMLSSNSRGDEWLAHIPAARIALHTGREIATNEHARMLAGETAKLRFLTQKFLDDCEAAEKIFVWRVLRDERGGRSGLRGMERLYDALAGLGSNRLLWVNEADEDHPHASVEHLHDGLYRGWIDRLTPHSDAYSFDCRSWLDLLAAAERAMEPGGLQA